MAANGGESGVGAAGVRGGWPAGPAIRIGHGYDLHRLEPVAAAAGSGGVGQIARPLVIGGVAFPSDLGPVAHSDGDALMHAITDAILGALGMPDIGQMFPDRDPRWRGAASEVFLAEARRLALSGGWTVGNVDATVILERPKLGPRKEEIRENLARILGIGSERVNIKGKTHELAPGGAGDAAEKAIEAHAVVLMVRESS